MKTVTGIACWSKTLHGGARFFKHIYSVRIKLHALYISTSIELSRSDTDHELPYLFSKKKRLIISVLHGTCDFKHETTWSFTNQCVENTLSLIHQENVISYYVDKWNLLDLIANGRQSHSLRCIHENGYIVKIMIWCIFVLLDWHSSCFSCCPNLNIDLWQSNALLYNICFRLTVGHRLPSSHFYILWYMKSLICLLLKKSMYLLSV